MVKIPPPDAWLLPILREILPDAALAEVEAKAGGSYWESALKNSAVTDEELLSILARKTRLSVANGLLVTSQARDRVPERLARRFSVLPLSLSDSTLEIATANPYDLDCERTLAFASGRSVRMSLASPMRIAERIDEVYSPADRVNRLLDGSLPARSGDLQRVADSADAEEQVDERQVERPVIRLVDHIVSEGIAAHASDIHLETGDAGVAVRYRIDGVLKEVMLLPRAVAGPLVSRIKIMSGMDIADRLRPQGGRARVALSGARVDLRVSTLPASSGEKVVIRILDQRSSVRSVEALGLDPVDGPRMQKLLGVREGLILVTGPTGSGKTTTLYAALVMLLRRGLNIITVEDPVEYRIPGIVQVQIHEKAGLTFASALRSVLRQDPDVVLIGEIRDRETAAIALQASLTGHLVFATLHTNDAASSITRLTDLGVDNVKLAGALKGVVAQRLLRRLCPSCKLVANAGVPEKLAGSLPPDSMIFMPTGCPDCVLTGYRGRLAVTEVLITTPEVERAIAEGESADRIIGAARRGGTRSLWGCAISHLSAGETSAEELMRVLEPEGARETARANGVPPPAASRDANGYDSYVSANHEGNAVGSAVRVESGVVEIYVLRATVGQWSVLALRRRPGTRSPGSWEAVYGKIDPGEAPEAAAVRELREETGFTPHRLYNVGVQSFYLQQSRTVQMAVVFAAFVDSGAEIRLSEEHDSHEWHPLESGAAAFTWPRAADALRDIQHLFAEGHAGPAEDVLRLI